MKTKNKILIGIIALALAVGFFIYLNRLQNSLEQLQLEIVELEKTLEEIKNEKLGQAIYLKNYYLGGNIATTSPTHFTTSTATTSLVYNTSAADLISIDINFDSSTTPSTLYWVNDFGDNLQDFYPETGSTVDSSTSVTHGTSEVIHQWTYASTTLTIDEAIRKSISIEPIASQLGRVRFWVSGASADLWVRVVVRERR